MRFLGEEAEIKINDEFCTWSWMPLSAVALQVLPAGRSMRWPA